MFWTKQTVCLIWDLCMMLKGSSPNYRSKRQTLFFSATMPPEIQSLANVLLTNPFKVEVTPVSSTADTIQQELYHVEKKSKVNLLIHILSNPDIKTMLVFSRTKHGADRISKN